MRRTPARRRSARRLAVVLAGTAALAGAIPALASPQHPSGVIARHEVLSVAAGARTVTVHWRGNGHGHGLSQYGARGAALQGLSARRILAFYYPGTTLTTLAPATVRVLLSGLGSTTVFAAGRTLSLTGYGPLPAGYQYFRLIAHGTGFTLRGERTGASAFTTVASGLPDSVTVTAPHRFLRVLLPDGTSTRYAGRISVERQGHGQIAVDRLPLDSYVAGVVPREMPASWSPAALQAQAVAARSYARAEMLANASAAYDICDSSSCQVYGGMAHLDASGTVLWQQDPAVVDGNAGQVLTYRGDPVFAQYSASNGGATVDGGQPYLIGEADPYDTAASGDPYLNEARTVPTATLARSLGLASISSITVTGRDGNGPWGGRVVSATVAGTSTAGTPTTVTTSGAALGDAAGVWTDYLRFGA